MIRYKLTNQKTGTKFQFEADEFPKEMQPEWGEDPLIEKEDITKELEARDAAKKVLAAAKDRVLKMSTAGMTDDQKAQHALLSAIAMGERDYALQVAELTPEVVTQALEPEKAPVPRAAIIISVASALASAALGIAYFAGAF